MAKKSSSRSSHESLLSQIGNSLLGITTPKSETRDKHGMLIKRGTKVEVGKGTMLKMLKKARTGPRVSGGRRNVVTKAMKAKAKKAAAALAKKEKAERKRWEALSDDEKAAEYEERWAPTRRRRDAASEKARKWIEDNPEEHAWQVEYVKEMAPVTGRRARAAAAKRKKARLKKFHENTILTRPGTK